MVENICFQVFVFRRQIRVIAFEIDSRRGQSDNDVWFNGRQILECFEHVVADATVGPVRDQRSFDLLLAQEMEGGTHAAMDILLSRRSIISNTSRNMC